MLAIAPKQTSVARDFTPHRGNSQSGKNGKGKYSLSKGIVPRVTRLVNSRGNGHLRYWKASAVSIMLTVLMTCEVFIPSNDIATEVTNVAARQSTTNDWKWWSARNTKGSL